MRLNFSGSDEDEIREGIRRIGKVVGEQVGLYQTITGEHRLPAGPTGESAAGLGLGDPAADELSDAADVLPLRRRREEG